MVVARKKAELGEPTGHAVACIRTTVLASVAPVELWLKSVNDPPYPYEPTSLSQVSPFQIGAYLSYVANGRRGPLGLPA